MGRASAALAIALIGIACNPKSLRPGFCHVASDCPSKMCNTDTRLCVSADASMDDADARDGGDGGDAEVAPYCTDNAQCGDGGANVCQKDGGICVECLEDSHCVGKSMTPICEARICRACKADSECPDPAICMTDGHCATSEVIFVEFRSTGCGTADGSSGNPYCAPNDAVAQLASDRNVIVIRGSIPTQMAIATSGIAPVIVGKPGAGNAAPRIAAPAPTVGIQISSDDVLIRDLAVGGGTDTTSRGIVATGSSKLTLRDVQVNLGMGLGIQADGASQLTMDRCTVTNNSRGGILVDNAMFEIGNTTVSNNGPGDDMGASWGGLRIRTSVAISPKVLQLITVQNNNQVGVSCSSNVSGTGVLVSGSLGGVDISPSCGFSSCGVTATSTCGAQ